MTLRALFFSDTVVLILLLLFVAAFLDFLTGALAALANRSSGKILGALDLSYLDTFVSSHLVKVLTLTLLTLGLQIISVAIDQFPNAEPLLKTGLQAALTAGWAAVLSGVLAYVVSTLNSVKGNLQEAGAQTKGLPSSVVENKV